MGRLLSAAPCMSLVSRRERAISHMLMQTQLGVAALAMLALSTPTELRGQSLDDGLSAPRRGPVEKLGRAGIGAATSSPVVFVMPVRGSEVARGDSSSRHGSRAHHVIVGALIGGTLGLVLGVAGDRPGLGRGEMRGGHFHNLWLVTLPLGAAVGALAGTVRQAD